MKIFSHLKTFRLRNCLGVSLGIVVLALSIHQLLDREPVYEGRKVSAWLAVISRERLVGDEGEAIDALKGAGPEVVPYLIDALKRKGSRFDAIYNTVLQKLPTRLQDRLPPFRDATNMRLKAGTLLQIISPTAKRAAIPELLTLINSPDQKVRNLAATSLIQFGTEAKPAVPKLIEYSTNSDWWLRVKACEILMAIGPDAKAAVPALVRRWQDEVPGTLTKDFALWALFAIDPETWEKVRP
jgi:hypothetical protein